MNCLYTLNVKNKQGFNTEFVSDRVRRSFISACFRWGCNYSEINHEPGFEDAKICNWGKLLGPQLLIGYESLLYLDGDMIISEHAPNPFHLCVKDDVMYAVADAQGVNVNNEVWKGAIYGAGVEKILARFPEFKQPTVERYFNTGFMMFRNTDKLRYTFKMILDNRDLEVPTCYDQTVLNLIVHNRMDVEILPETWNYIVWERAPNPDAYILHFIHAGPSLA
jgi:lipopolysaccharide biosynthesis glycosyltransferase